MWEGPRGHSQLSRGRDSVAGRHGPRHSGDSGLCALLPGFSRVFGQGSQGIAGLIRSLRPNGVSAVGLFSETPWKGGEKSGEPFPGFKPAHPMVYAGIFPEDTRRLFAGCVRVGVVGG